MKKFTSKKANNLPKNLKGQMLCSETLSQIRFHFMSEINALQVTQCWLHIL